MAISIRSNLYHVFMLITVPPSAPVQDNTVTTVSPCHDDIQYTLYFMFQTDKREIDTIIVDT